jgi:hypothetical protein
MNDVERQIRARIERFVSELNELVRQSALEAVSDALRGNVARRAPVGLTLNRAVALGPRRGAKRSPQQIEHTVASVLSHVRTNPGQGIEQMAHEMGMSTRDLTLPIKKLLGSGDLITEGHKRATKYFASGNGSSAISGASGAARGRRRPAKAAKAASKATKKGGRKRRARRK